jgi:hypothetical protein
MAEIDYPQCRGLLEVSIIGIERCSAVASKECGCDIS